MTRRIAFNYSPNPPAHPNMRIMLATWASKTFVQSQLQSGSKECTASAQHTKLLGLLGECYRVRENANLSIKVIH